MRKPKSPCGICVERAIGCHSCCESYNAFQQQIKDYNHLVAENARWEDRVKYSRSRLRQMYK